MIKKINSIQALRGFAIIFIMLSHCAFVIGSNGDTFETQIGCFGVSIFIMISGFLASRKANTIKEESVPINSPTKYGFFKQLLGKILKFWPLHFITFALSIPLCIGLAKESISNFVMTGLCNLAMVHSFVPIKSFYFSFNFVSWYLTLTLFFMIIAPVASRIFKLKFIPSCIILFLLTALSLSLYFLFSKSAYYYYILYICPLTRTIDYLIGGLIFNIVVKVNQSQFFSDRSKKNISLISIILSFLGCVIILIVGYKNENPFFLNHVWIYPTFLLMIGFSIDSKWIIPKYIFENKVIVFIGNISFELFLIHQIIIRYFSLFCTKIEGNINLGFVCAIILAFALAYLYQKGNIIVKKKLKGNTDKIESAL